MSQQSEISKQKEAAKVPAAVRREFGDPQEGSRPVPMWLAFSFGLIACVAGAYFGMYHGGFRGTVYNESESSPELFSDNAAQAGEATAVVELSLAEQGKSVYANCVPCHQASGLGLPGQFPTLVASDWVQGSEKRLVAILLKGVNGALKVGDATYNGAMPPWEAALSDKKIAAVASFIRSSWGNKSPEISEAKVKAARKEFAAQKAPWTQDDLMKIPADATLDGGADAGPAAGGAATAGEAKVDLEAGKAQYAAVCIACHQPTGMGLPPVFPPLVNSEYVTGDPDRIIAIVLKGVQGPITVNGQLFTNVMPAQEAVLTDSKISQIVSYVRGSFGGGASPVTVEQVSNVRKKLAGKTVSWTEAELKAFTLGAAEAK
ncbi:MAG: cytochrome c [Verrucomicrobiota bacterium]